MPPQDELEKEEVKEEPKFNLLTHVANETRAYLNAVNVVAISLEADLQNLFAQKREMEKVLVSLAKHKSVEDFQTQTIKSLDAEIKRIDDKLLSNRK